MPMIEEITLLMSLELYILSLIPYSTVWKADFRQFLVRLITYWLCLTYWS